MIDPFEHHPEDKREVSKNKLTKSVKIEDVKRLFEEELNSIRKEQTPLWGYNENHIENIFSNLIKNISELLGEKHDS